MQARSTVVALTLLASVTGLLASLIGEGCMRHWHAVFITCSEQAKALEVHTDIGAQPAEAHPIL